MSKIALQNQNYSVIVASTNSSGVPEYFRCNQTNECQYGSSCALITNEYSSYDYRCFFPGSKDYIKM